MGGNIKGRRAPNALIAMVRRPALRNLAGGRRGAFTALTLASYPALIAWPWSQGCSP